MANAKIDNKLPQEDNAELILTKDYKSTLADLKKRIQQALAKSRFICEYRDDPSLLEHWFFYSRKTNPFFMGNENRSKASKRSSRGFFHL